MHRDVWNKRKDEFLLFPLASALCSLLKTGPTVGEPVAIFSKQGVVTQKSNFPFPPFEKNKTKKKQVGFEFTRWCHFPNCGSCCSTCQSHHVKLNPSVRAMINIQLDMFRRAEATALSYSHAQRLLGGLLSQVGIKRSSPDHPLFKTLKSGFENEKKGSVHSFIPESMTRKGDSKHNQLSFSKANTPAGKLFLLEFLSAFCRVGKVGSRACTVYVCAHVHAYVCVCAHTMPVAPVSSAPHAAHFMCPPLAKTEH